MFKVEMVIKICKEEYRWQTIFEEINYILELFLLHQRRIDRGFLTEKQRRKRWWFSNFSFPDEKSKKVKSRNEKKVKCGFDERNFCRKQRLMNNCYKSKNLLFYIFNFNCFTFSCLHTICKYYCDSNLPRIKTFNITFSKYYILFWEFFRNLNLKVFCYCITSKFVNHF